MVRTIGPREAEALITKGGLDVVDVREPHEWASGHLPGARLVPLGTVLSAWESAQIGDPVLFVCAKGGRSTTAAELAEKNGRQVVYSLEGGTVAWRAEGLGVVVPPAPEATDDTSVELEAPDTELDTTIGANVRELRAKRGLTLDLLAGLSGVGRQTLGQIELGRTVPSVATLWKIAKAFEVPFSALLARPEAVQTVILRGRSARRLVSADGRFSSRALYAPDQRGKMEFYELWLAGHGREDAEAHASGTRESLVVTSGRLVIELASTRERHELAKGDAIVFVADTPHSYINPASEECWMNLVMTYAD
jgi:rhodanese-related sulfurtransferase/transcriptional regulator with XRE-family HTH domain